MFIGQFLEGNKMTPLKINNGGSYAPCICLAGNVRFFTPLRLLVYF